MHSRDDAHHGHAEPVVETQHPLGAPRRLAQAVPQAGEVALARPHVRGETGPCEVEGVHEAKATRAGQTAGGDVDGEEFGEVILGADLKKGTKGCGVLCFKVERGEGGGGDRGRYSNTLACCAVSSVVFSARVAIYICHLCHTAARAVSFVAVG